MNVRFKNIIGGFKKTLVGIYNSAWIGVKLIR